MFCLLIARPTCHDLWSRMEQLSTQKISMSTTIMVLGRMFQSCFDPARTTAQRFNLPNNTNSNESAGLQIGLGISASAAQLIIDSKFSRYYDKRQCPLGLFRCNSARSDQPHLLLRCVDQAKMYARAVNDALAATYFLLVRPNMGRLHSEKCA
jgi:hypothetical protein